mgnify:CR=1 FL=1
MLLKVEKSREMYVTHTLSLHYFYTHIPTLKQAILFFYIFSQPFQIADSISRFCYVLYGMSNHFFKCILIHTGFFPIVTKVVRGSWGLWFGFRFNWLNHFFKTISVFVVRYRPGTGMCLSFIIKKDIHYW